MGIRVYKLAKELKIESKDLVERLKKLNIDLKGHMSVLDDETAEIARHEIKDQLKKTVKEQKPRLAEEKPSARMIKVDFPITVKDLAVKMQIKPNELIKALMKHNVFAHINQPLEEDVVKSISSGFGYQVERAPTTEEVLITEHEKPSDTSNMVLRPPVVTMMGHVDHGKTSLLDAIRQSHVVDQESGDITQHIGAYEVDLNKGKVVFLDTPGHEAFTKMRARGAHATDVVVLVIAADDGVMPQTIEAIDHARAAGVPIIAAVNKIDLPSADPDKVKRGLQNLNLTPEEWGGKTIFVEVSAKTRQGIDNLLDMLLLEAEMLELKADPARPAKGVVIEGRISRGKGPVATVLVKNGTLKPGQTIISGLYFGKIKAMINSKGETVDKAGPSIPVEILGLSGVPQAGDSFYVVTDEKQARQITLMRQEQTKQKELGVRQKISLEKLYDSIKAGQIKELNLIIKADVKGSVEVLTHSLEKIGSEEVKVNIIHSGLGRINESDVMLASASNAVIIGFHVGPEPKAADLARQEKVDIRLYDIIYNVLEEIRKAMEGLLEPELKDVVTGRARVKQVFKIGKAGIIAGCLVEKGKIIRSGKMRVIRDNELIYEGSIKSLKRFKDDVREVSEGYECGLAIENFNDMRVDDLLECYQVEKIARRLE